MLFRSSFAQDGELGLSKLSAEDEKRYREIVSKPIDESQLNLKKIAAYKEKEQAFIMLGENNGREENMIAWSKIDPDAKWSLRQYWSVMGRFEEAFKIGNEIIAESRFPPSAVRMRTYMAHDYLLTNQIDKAKELLDKAESIMKYEFGGIRRGRADTSLWIARAEAEFYFYKSVFYLRVGKSEDAMNMGRIALRSEEHTSELQSH